jgi:tripeptide aminopeptidase
MVFNQERLAETFITLCQIDSPSKQEKNLADFIQALFSREFPAAQIREDNSSAGTGSEANNFVVRFTGTMNGEPLFLNCHLDTVEPCRGVTVKREGNIFTSAGETILGGDDKAGIAIVLEVMRVLHEQQIPFRPVELLFTTCEEIGLLGAKHLDHGLLQARFGYCLDSDGTDRLIIGAPAANHFSVEIMGRAAHAGLCPEKGISAIQIASQAIAGMKLGRLDEESTANIGIIQGGTASNIIPDQVFLKGEVRSHNAEKLARYTRQLEERFQGVVRDFVPGATPGDDHRPACVFQAAQQYPLMRLQQSDFVVQHAIRCAIALDRQLELVVAGGGSDANIFNDRQLQTAILGIGMKNVHSVQEQISLADLVQVAQLVASLITH